LFAYGTATGRNAQAKSLFNAHAGMRSFMLFPPESIVVYIDWRCQEVAVAGARSGDRQLMADYATGDVYYALARMCELTKDPDIQRWKDTESGQRQLMKALQLGINYDMGIRSLAKGLGRHRLIASEVLIRHHARYETFWKWKADVVQRAMFERVIESEYDGWPLHISNSPNKRTLVNYQMQSGGASMLRLAATRLCDAGLAPSMLVHDGILLELQTDDQVAQAIEIMRVAGKEVCNGFEVGADVDFDSRKKGQRFIDKRPVAKAMWQVIMDVLQEIGALPKTGGL
jgi:DNA polymerase I-like protein with 3'-5' exonuclease and polymerase domains